MRFCRINRQVQNQRKCLKNSRFGVENLGFSPGLAFVMARTFFWEGNVRVAEVRAFRHGLPYEPVGVL